MRFDDEKYQSQICEGLQSQGSSGKKNGIRQGKEDDPFQEAGCIIEAGTEKGSKTCRENCSETCSQDGG